MHGRIRYFCLIVLAGLCISSSAQNPSALLHREKTKAPQQNQQPLSPRGNGLDSDKFSLQLVGMTRDWLGNKLSTANTGAEMREMKRQHLGRDLLVVYHVFVTGAPKDQLYDLVQWPTDAEKPFVAGHELTIASDGLVKSQDHEVDFALHPAKGEPYRLGLVSADGKTRVLFGVVPDPILATNKSCTVEVVGLLPKFPLAMIRAKGYEPNEELLFTSKSYDEVHDMRVTSDANGEFVTAILPKVKDKDAGKTEVALKGKSCAPKLSFEWGK